MKTRSEQLALVALASRAPSAHNTQPARFRFESDGTISLFEDVRRRLHVGDPTGRDAMIGLGAALEGLSLALGAQGLGIAQVDLASGHDVSGDVREVARTRAVPAGADVLAPYLSSRRAYRGVFAPAGAEVATFSDAARTASDVRVITGRSDIEHAAELLDSCSLEFMRDSRYAAELWEWMRLTPSDPRWHRDGLNADCLELTGLERAAARLLMRPSVFSLLSRIGFAGAIVSEARPVRSATAIVLLHRPMDEHPVVTGRRFHRLWLELARAGLSACPMSAITDSASGSDALRRRYQVPDDRRIINAFRVGVAPHTPARSARLPADELLV